MASKKTMSWGWIIFWCILLWPLGLFFLFRKIGSDKTATLKNSKTVAVISYVLIGLGIIYLVMSIAEDANMIAAAVVFGGGGVCLFLVSRRMKKNGIKYKKYISLVVNQQQKQIDIIAAEVGVRYETAKNDLLKMIDNGYFVGAYINETNREIVLLQPVYSSSVQPVYAIPPQMHVVACRGCGANNMAVVGQVKECDYCSSPVG